MAEPSPDNILFRCHACRQKFAVRPTRMGAKFECSKCGSVLQVPNHSALDNPAASKPDAPTQQPQPRTGTDEVRIDDTALSDSRIISSAEASAIFSMPAKREPQAPATKSQAPPQTRAESSGAAGHNAPAPAVVPAGKKACPNCAHICPGMALSCPLCQHRFEVSAPKPKVSGNSAVSDALSATAGTAPPPPTADAKADSKAGAPTPARAPKKDLGKMLDDAVTIRGKGVGRPVEPPMWMDEVVYGAAIKMGFAGLCCMVAAVVIFVQLSSPESARNAFFLVRWIYQLTNFGNHSLGRSIPACLCLGMGLAFLYMAIKPVVDLIKRERELKNVPTPEK